MRLFKKYRRRLVDQWLSEHDDLMLEYAEYVICPRVFKKYGVKDLEELISNVTHEEIGKSVGEIFDDIYHERFDAWIDAHFFTGAFLCFSSKYWIKNFLEKDIKAAIEEAKASQ